MSRGRIITWVGVLALLGVPYFVDSFWLQVGALVMAAAVAAIGLDLLVGVAGQISLAHAAFVGLGAYSYVTFASESTDSMWGLGWPPLLAALAAVVVAGLAGLALSPLAGRVSGLYLAVVTIGVVYVWQHVLHEVGDFSGGAIGRQVPEFSIGSLSFGDSDPWMIGSVPFGAAEKMWVLCLAVLVVAYVAARNLLGARPGRALAMVRESPIAAQALGIDVGRARTAAFALAAVYAGVAGVLVALSTGFINSQGFGFMLSTDYLVMIIIGGLGSLRGAIIGAVFVTALPRVLGQYADTLPFLSPTGSGGLDASALSVIVYCVLLIVVIMFSRSGLDGWWEWVVPRKRHAITPPGRAAAMQAQVPDPAPQPEAARVST